jgi:hypothetical protein
MKTKIKKAKTLFFLAICSILISACQKTAMNSSDYTQLSEEERALLGKWNLERTETYEISGIDSTGQYICDLIGLTFYNTPCFIEFKIAEQHLLSYPQLLGKGLIGDCDSTASFSWIARQHKLQVIGNNGSYHIDYLQRDSAALSYVHQKDILKLRSVFYYKRR